MYLVCLQIFIILLTLFTYLCILIYSGEKAAQSLLLKPGWWADNFYGPTAISLVKDTHSNTWASIISGKTVLIYDWQILLD